VSDLKKNKKIYAPVCSGGGTEFSPIKGAATRSKQEAKLSLG